MSFETPVPPYNASDPNATFLSSSCFDFLLIEIVPLAQRMASDLSTRRGSDARSTDDETQRDIVFRRLETLGYRVGQGIAERYTRAKERTAMELCAGRADALTLTPDSLAIALGLLTLWMSSSFYAKTYGHYYFESRLTI